MRVLRHSLAALWFLAWVWGAPHSAAAASAQEVLSHLVKQHPRLLLNDAGLGSLKTRIASDENLKLWQSKVHEWGQEILRLPPVEQDLSSGERNLVRTRLVESRVVTLAFLYRLEGDRAYLDRAWTELETAARFPSWNPEHFLDVAEMTFAFAIGYDWLYQAWTPEQRSILREAILNHGLHPAVANPWWKTVRHNWNLVCNGGIGTGALAIADEEPDISSRALQIALDSAPFALESYAPDGAWEEGVGYWDYATTFAVYLMASLESATGSDAGLSTYPGFSRTGMFPLQLTGPADMAFNFGDAPPFGVSSPSLFWLARKFHLPLCRDYQEKHIRLTRLEDSGSAVMNMMWYFPGLGGAQEMHPALGVYYPKLEVLCMRTAWNDPNASFVGFKAGDNSVNHSHLDLGTFVFDAGGCRFARQGGAEDYGKPGYFDTKDRRWSYYRVRAEGTNTLVINPGQGPDQDPKATATMRKVKLDVDEPFAVADLSQAYAHEATSVYRGIKLLKGGRLLIEDEILTPKPSELWWFMHTKAEVADSSISGDGHSVMLRGLPQGALLRAELLSPSDARFQICEASPLPGTHPAANQSENPGVRKLAIHLSGAGAATIAVLLTPASSGSAAAAAQPVRPLAQW